MKRPVLKLTPKPMDYIIQLITWCFLLFLWSLFFYYYGILPDEIPVHFDFGGHPDQYGSKAILISLPLLATLLVAGISVLVRFPHYFNYLVEITQENARIQYTYATRLLRFISLLLALLFTAIFYEVIYVSLYRQAFFGWIILVVVLGLLLAMMIVYFINASKDPTN
ncbi:SdpI family protein [Schleiferia thermophila]|jgi:uncharacterized membrane protein|nr:DUF1648 domain-containing protein [Schleiferia thermophila]KFD39078.1 hypothetical protein AT05_06780 [Schleiferia thermophila str. Yellowstone]GCD80750.1 hypothetical protein JCM30197_19970 [Schleiferia thermophila]